MVHVAEGAGPAERLHDLLLAMAGRVDDDGINSARELLGTGLPGAAAAYLTGCLIAGRIPVDTTEQHQLRRVLEETRSAPGLADRLNAVDGATTGEHRFGDPGDVDASLAAALAPVTARLQGLRGLWCTARTTPAGVSYGAVPRRVLLAEVGSGGSTPAVAYQLLEALRRAGLNCSVEVFDSGAELPEYHREALAAAHRVHLDAAPAEPVAERPVEQAVEQQAPAEPTPEPAPEPAPAPAPVEQVRAEQQVPVEQAPVEQPAPVVPPAPAAQP
ncbi:hypothetical protein, partial [Saccharopolyspora sp. NPDC002686]|uniref:hypothetical protein n=1 Tax=Saccharopolyspora sp. NPDC002686 TaxID=3154541 RepID=UPI003323EB65